MTSFPEDFFWGASTAPHQNEGNNTNSDMWALEQLTGSSFSQRSGDGLDFYHRWKNDIDLLRSLGLTAFRFGIEWARVEPVRGHVAQAELAHYRRIIEYCFEVGVEPVVTLHHFSSPLWFVEAGGWTSDEAVDLFGQYVAEVAPVLEGVTWVATINEPNMFAVMHQMSTPLQYDDPQTVLARMREAASPVSGEAGSDDSHDPSP